MREDVLLMGTLVVILGEILDVSSLFTLFFVYRANKLWHLFLIVFSATFLKEMLRYMFSSTYRPFDYLIATVIAQFIVGSVFYLALYKKRNKIRRINNTDKNSSNDTINNFKLLGFGLPQVLIGGLLLAVFILATGWIGIILLLGGLYIWRSNNKERKKSLLTKEHMPSINTYLENMRLFQEITIKTAIEEINTNVDLSTFLVIYILEASDVALEFWRIPKDIYREVKTITIVNMGYKESEAMGMVDAVNTKIYNPYTNEIEYVGGNKAFHDWLKATNKDIAINQAVLNIQEAIKRFVIGENLTRQLRKG